MASVRDIFDPAHYENVRRPLLEAETLPPWCYTSQAFYEREVERMFKKTWNFIGRVDEVAEPGDYMTFELFGEPLIILRDKAGKVRAFANTCRHRGACLLEGRGNCRVISCPYHGWAYALSGELVATPGMERTLDFDSDRYGLLPVRLETWDGFIFVSFDADCTSLSEHLGELPERLRSYNFADMVCVRRKEYDLACNWKIYLENAMEDYHTPTVHKKSIGKQVTMPQEGPGEWDAIHMPAEKSIALLPEDAAFALPEIAGLEGQAAAGTYFLAIYPATFFALTQDCMWWLQLFPLGPDRSKLVAGPCFPRDTVARGDFAEKVQAYYRRWDKSLGEDNRISETQQAGLKSSFSRPGRFSFHEPVVQAIANWVLDHVLD